MKPRPVKQAVAALEEELRTEGHSIVSLETGTPVWPLPEGRDVMNVTAEENLFQIPAAALEEFPRRQLRRALYEHRNDRALHRPNAILWGAIDGDTVYVGVGALVREDLPKRTLPEELLNV